MPIPTLEYWPLLLLGVFFQLPFLMFLTRLRPPCEINRAAIFLFLVALLGVGMILTFAWLRSDIVVFIGQSMMLPYYWTRRKGRIYRVPPRPKTNSEPAKTSTYADRDLEGFTEPDFSDLPERTDSPEPKKKSED